LGAIQNTPKYCGNVAYSGRPNLNVLAFGAGTCAAYVEVLVSAFFAQPSIGVPANDPRASPPQLQGSASSLFELLYLRAQKDPGAAAVVALGRTPLSFGALLDQFAHIRTTLNSRGLGRGDRIAVLGSRGPETAVALLGVACCATCVPMNPGAPSAELQHGLTETGAKALLVSEDASGDVKELARRAGIVLLEYSTDESAPAGRFRIQSGPAGIVAERGPAQGSDIAFILRTSGTSSRSKIVPITHRNVVARTEKSRRMFEIGPGDCCFNLMPLCYHHGLNNGLMLPLVSGSAVICPPAFDADTFLACMRDHSPTFYTGGFTYYQAILEWLRRHPNTLDGHRIRFMRAGSGPLTAEIRVAIEKIVGAPLLEVYGTTETGTVAGNSLVGKRKPGTVGASPDNDVAIADDDGNLLQAGKEGEVVVRGPTVFAGYENDPAANQRVFRGEWYRTGDQGVIDDDGCIRLLGRHDEVINRGGEKISPREVDDALLAHDAVVEAVSFPTPHPTLHQEIAAAVVLRHGAKATSQDLRRFLMLRLAPFKVPRVVICTDQLPKGPTGKFVRKDLAEHFAAALTAADTGPRSGALTEAGTETEKLLLALWRDVLKRREIGVDDNFFLFGGDSLSAVDLINRIEQSLQHQLPVNLLVEAPTVRQLAQCLETGALAPADNIIRIHTKGAQRPLFAIGGTGGYCLYLYSVLHALGADQPCYGLQPPGMDWTAAGCSSIADMARHYLKAVRSIQPRGPYRLMGHSFGGRLVFEMALQLQEMGEPVEFLGLLDTYPSRCPEEGEANVSRQLLKELPPPRNPVEAFNYRVIEAHWNASRSHRLDDRSERDIFRGELTYFYCAGEPVVAGQDRRGLWPRFAHQFRLLPLPGLHGWTGRGPQYRVLPALLGACLNGTPVKTSDPEVVFGRTYQLEMRAGREIIQSSTGEIHLLDQAVIQGYVDTLAMDVEAVRLGGWAVDRCQQKPAQVIAVFLGDRFVGYGACGTARSDIAQQFSMSALEYSGFDFTFWRGAGPGALERPRLFVLSDNGSAAELRFMVVQEAAQQRTKVEELSAKLAALATRLGRWRIQPAGASLRRCARCAG
jgi:acyl-CoA synthetase (AMP-forming)/AMP-acid ligase II/pimeloyl-ACP methyl ester carboxylesterase/acyl carrier protein